MKSFETYGGTIPGLSLDELSGWLIVIEGTDGAGRSTQVARLRAQLGRLGFAVAETGLTRSDLASKGIRRAKDGNSFRACLRRPGRPFRSLASLFPPTDK